MCIRDRTDRERERETDRHTETQTHRERDRQTQTERDRESETEVIKGERKVCVLTTTRLIYIVAIHQMV